MVLKKTRERPQPLRRLAPAVRENWNRAVLRCLEPDPGKRYQAARELLVDLESRSSRLRLFRRFLRQRRRWIRGTGAAAAVVLLAWLGWWLWPAHPGAEARLAWESGAWALQAGEPILAAGRLEQASAGHRLPAIVHAQLAQAWLEAGFAARARKELCTVSMAQNVVARQA